MVKRLVMEDSKFKVQSPKLKVNVVLAGLAGFTFIAKSFPCPLTPTLYHRRGERELEEETLGKHYRFCGRTAPSE